MKQNYFLLVVALLFTIGAAIRLYNFENRLVFGPEQGISLLTSATNLEKVSLLGEYNLQRQTSDGHNLIHGPLFSYFLLPFIVLFNFRVFPITLIFVLLNLLAGLILFLVANKYFGRVTAVLTLLFFLTSSLMIYHSTFIWIYHPLILLGALSIGIIGRIKENPSKPLIVYWLGLISGIGFSLQYPFLITALFLLGLSILLTRNRKTTLLVFIGGFLTANLTRVIFDIRHDFYHLRTMWQYFLDVYVEKTTTGQLYPYHYLPYYPFFCLILGILSAGIYHLKKPLVIIPISIYLYLNFSSPMLNFSSPVGMPPGLTIKSLEQTAATIAADQPPTRYNIVTLWDFDTRARPLRYLLTYYHDKKPSDVENYSNNDAIYAFAPVGYDMANPRIWELSIYQPYQITELSSPAAGYKLYKLTK